MTSATVITHPNIALIKYWGNSDHALRIPANASLSMTLGGLDTQVSVQFDDELAADDLVINGETAAASALARVGAHLDLIRALAGSAFSWN